MKLIIILLLTFVSFYSSAQKEDWKKAGLAGKVKSVTESRTSLYYQYSKNTYSAWEKSGKEITSFDNTGRISEYQKFDTMNALGYKITYSYNSKEKNAQVQNFDKNSQPTAKELWLYNEKKQKIEEQKFSKDAVLNYRYMYDYDAAGNMTMRTTFYPDGKMIDKFTYTYDAKKNMLSEIYEASTFQSNHVFSYDSKGNRTGELWYSPKKEIEFRIINVYDTNGNIISFSKYKSDSDIAWNTGAWKYEYDLHNNWIKKTSYDPDGIELGIITRVVEYY